jgi:SAM-dependent methyltransferase
MGRKNYGEAEDVMTEQLLCKSCQSSYVYPYVNLSRRIFGGKDYSILLCRDCGVGVTFPEPTASIDHYVDSDRPEIISAHVKNSIAQEILRMKAEYHGIFGVSPRRILDVGCGNGLFMLVAKELGFETHGLEPSLAMCRRVIEKGLTVTQCAIDEYENYHQFDLIVFNSVIEHLPDPVREVRFVAGQLGPKTVVCFQQAVYDGLIPKFLKSTWYGWAPEEHYWHYSGLSFQSFIEKHQLKVVAKTRTNLYYKSVSLKSIRHWKSYLFSNFQKILSVVASFVNRGDSVTFYAVRRDSGWSGGAS